MSRFNIRIPPGPCHPPPTILEPVHPQTDSPLLNLPAELRLKIYEYVLTSADNPNKPYKKAYYHYRPGVEFAPKYDFQLIQTCRRVFFETRHMPIALNDIELYLYRGPNSWLPKYSRLYWWHRFSRLNLEQRQAVGTVHYFAQQCYLESVREWRFIRVNSEEYMSAKRFVLTLRHSDWWTWESPLRSNDQLGICPWKSAQTSWTEMEAEPLEGPENESQWNNSWGGQFRYIRGLEVLEIEMETIEAKRSQLERVVERAKHWKFPLEGDWVLAWTGQIQESTWQRSARLKDDPGEERAELTPVTGRAAWAVPTYNYLVIKMTWRKAPKTEPSLDALTLND